MIKGDHSQNFNKERFFFWQDTFKILSQDKTTIGFGV
jgi:hypothetical protein